MILVYCMCLKPSVVMHIVDSSCEDIRIFIIHKHAYAIRIEEIQYTVKTK